MEPGTPRGGPVDPLFDPGPPELQSAGSAWGLGLCQECLGRCFGRLGHGLDNPERARRLGVALGRALPDLPTTGCSLCRGLFDRWETWVARAVAALEGLEGARFSCGSRWEPEILAREEWIWAEIGTPHGESARGAFNREWGKRIEVASGRTGGREEPDLVLLADLPVGRVEVTVQPLYVRGRYRKLDRTIPQTRWPCRRCGGAGCDACGGSGKTYPTSVEELIAAPFLRATEGSDSRFHGMGREDIDARMLGRGRPFVLEIRRPKRRTLDLPVLLAEVHRGAEGRVEVLEARRAGGRDVQLVKEASPSKSYRVGVLGDLSEEKVKEAL
ncbi:MAG TPA: tRNA pseudouridine(54/55) synthase Pus10, partial [Thermoplasmata archaeon]|nr:tRNA pseudouridine(54/55) synthase Pus10 [Thermoplasmata archaeon]